MRPSAPGHRARRLVTFALTVAPLLLAWQLAPKGAAAAGGSTCSPVLRTTGELKVDWSGWQVQVLAHGLPRHLSHQAMLIDGDLAVKARSAAQQRLEQVLGQLPLDALTRVGEAGDSDRELSDAVAAIVAGMRPTRELVLSDGTAVYESQVSLEPLKRWAVAPPAEPPPDGEQLVALPLVMPVLPGEGAPAEQPVVGPTRPGFTGVVVDARELPGELSPSLIPTLRGPLGELLLRSSEVIVYCAGDGGDLTEHVGERPLEVVARDVWGRLKTDPVLGQGDASALAAAFPGRRAPLVILVPDLP